MGLSHFSGPIKKSLHDGPAGVAAGASRREAAWLYARALIFFGLLYAFTAQRGPAWQDSGEYQLRIMDWELTNRLGLALSHPLLIVLGRAFAALPFGEAPWRINLLMALCGGVATANIALLVRRLAPGRPLAAWIAAGFWGLAHTPWWLATICESQAIVAAFFTLELNLLLSLARRPGVLAAGALGLANGAAWNTHNLALLALPAYGVTVAWLCASRRMRWTALAAMIACWCAGASLMLALAAREAARIGLPAAIESLLFGSEWRGRVLGGSAPALKMGALCVLLNFPNLALPLAAFGLWKMRPAVEPAFRRAFYYLVAIYLLFAIRYNVTDQFMFFLPFYALVATAAGVGFAQWAYRGKGAGPAFAEYLGAAHPRQATRGGVGLGGIAARAMLAIATMGVGPCLYAAGPSLWRAVGLKPIGRTDLPGRDAVRYWMTPWKNNEDSAQRFAAAAVRQAPASADCLVIADSTAWAPLKLAWRNMENRPRIVLDTDLAPSDVPPGTPNVYTTSNLPGYYPAWFEHEAILQRAPGESLFKVTWLKAER
jgi:hypothetical protein